LPRTLRGFATLAMATSRRFLRLNCNRHAISLLCFLESVLERIIVVICLRVANACNIFVRCLVWAGISLLEERFGCRVLCDAIRFRPFISIPCAECCQKRLY
jgi:hypothetical protein